MDLRTVTAIRAELESELVGRRLGRIFQLSKFDLAIDLRISAARYLFISIQPGNPRTYLIKRRLRDLEKASVNASAFPLVLRKRLSGAEVSEVTQISAERVLFVWFTGVDETELPVRYGLTIQLTGTSSNLFLLDADSRIVETMRPTRGEGQQIGDLYQPPVRPAGDIPVPSDVGALPTGSLSERLDAENLARSSADRIDSLAATARNKLRQEISRRKKLQRKLEDDLAGHGNADRWKRFGDLLLANVGTARRQGDKVFVTDYFDDATPEIEIEVDENNSLTEAAEKFFKLYTKARNAAREIRERRAVIEEELDRFEKASQALEAAIRDGDVDRLAEFAGVERESKPREARRKTADPSPGVRVFISPDGFEILVGKKAKDNDHLTFRMAKSLDTWMHAADYPGSHVVIRNPTRKDIPPKTLLEAAQLAAFYSQGKTQPKAAVHYTQKKFVNKPKGAAPGLVSLASFKTLLVEPKIGEVKSKARESTR